MQPQQPFGAPKQPLRPTASQNPFLASRPVAPTTSAMPAMQTATPRPMGNGPVVGNPVMGGRQMPQAAPAASMNSQMNNTTSAEDLLAGIGANDDKKSDSKEDAVVFDSSKDKNKDKSSKMMLYVAIGCGVLAVAGVVFGVLGMMKKPETRVETKIEKTVDDVAAVNLIEPYLTSIAYATNIIDSGITEAAKFATAFNNVVGRDMYVNGENYSVTYTALNAKYRELFGTNAPEQNVDGGAYMTASYGVDENGIGWFYVTAFPVQGAGLVPVTRVMGTRYNEENELVVEVYHDNVSVCGYANVTSGYCFDPLNIGEEAIDAIIEQYGDQMPTAQLIFSNEISGYSLVGIIKSEAVVPEDETTPDENTPAEGDEVVEEEIVEGETEQSETPAEGETAQE